MKLEPGETQSVYFPIDKESLQLLDQQMQWVVEEGEFEIRVGTSSEHYLMAQLSVRSEV